MQKLFFAVYGLPRDQLQLDLVSGRSVIVTNSLAFFLPDLQAAL